MQHKESDREGNDNIRSMFNDREGCARKRTLRLITDQNNFNYSSVLTNGTITAAGLFNLAVKAIETIIKPDEHTFNKSPSLST